MQREEAVQRRIVDRKTTEQQLLDRLADPRECREEAGDHRRPPERHLTPRQNITHEPGCHHQEEDQDAQDPEHFAWSLVGAVIQTASDMQVDGDKEE